MVPGAKTHTSFAKWPVLGSEILGSSNKRKREREKILLCVTDSFFDCLIIFQLAGKMDGSV